jgi:nitrate reductase NapE component
MTKREKWMVAGLAAVGTWFVFRSTEEESRSLSDEKRNELINFLAVKLGIEPAVALAVFSVESGKLGAFGSDGRMVIRFEPHIFRRRSKKYTGKTLAVPADHRGQAAEHRTFEKAAALHRRSALESISMGIGQIMGFNHKDAGYPNAEAQWTAFNQSEVAQIRGFFRFVEQNQGGVLLRAAKKKDFIEFAHVYNGCKRPCSAYAPKMKAAYNKWKSKGY